MAKPEPKSEEKVAHIGLPPRARMRYELALSAVAGVALHQPDKPMNIAMHAVRIADAVLEVLERPKEA